MEGLVFASTQGCFYQWVFDWSQSNCPGAGSVVRAALDLLIPKNVMAERRVVLYRSGVLVKHTLGSDPAVQALNHSEPGLPLLKARGNLGSLKSAFWGLLFFS